MRGVGARIRRLRRRLGVTQGELVRRTGLQASYLSKVENGVVTPGLPNLNRIARAMGISLAELVAPLGTKGRTPTGAKKKP
jgi:transcriptional regulator with XRE-family HTH domain